MIIGFYSLTPIFSRYKANKPFLLLETHTDVSIMATIPFQPSAPINVGPTHAGLERLLRMGRFFAHVYASMLAAQERAAMARLARYQVSVYRVLLERDHRLAEDFYAAKTRSKV